VRIPWIKGRRGAAGLVALGVTVLALLVFSARYTGHFDLNVYYGATRAWLHGGDLYGYVRHGGDGRDYGFTYPPFAAVFFTPLAVLPWPVAVVALDCLTVGATIAVLHWLLRPPVWLLPVGLLAAAALDPWRATLNYGQVNVLLLALVTADMLLLVRHGRKPAGVLIGVATAVKLVPGLFVVYLLLTRRWRAAAVAAGTTAGLSLLMWDADRVGDPAFVSNQSLNGVVARLGLNSFTWFTLVLFTLAAFTFLAIRCATEPLLGLALTGVVMCLVSPITWVHHLVWLIPALATLLEVRSLVWFLPAFGVLCSRLVWHFRLTADAYVLVEVLLVALVPVVHSRWRHVNDKPEPAAIV
jgi:alpha-1,2-mannosyltransferase